MGMSGTRGVRRSSFLPHTIPNRSDRRRRSVSSSCRINHSDDLVLSLSRGRVVAFSELEGCAREQTRERRASRQLRRCVSKKGTGPI